MLLPKYYNWRGEKCKTKKSYSTSKHYRSLTFTDHDNNTWKYLYICFVVVVLLVEASILIFLTRNFQPKPSFRFRGISEKFLFLGIIHKPGRQLKREGLGNCVHYFTAPHIVLGTLKWSMKIENFTRKLSNSTWFVNVLNYIIRPSQSKMTLFA